MKLLTLFLVFAALLVVTSGISEDVSEITDTSSEPESIEKRVNDFVRAVCKRGCVQNGCYNSAKDGTCPHPGGRNCHDVDPFSVPECFMDLDCDGTKKCCDDGCGHYSCRPAIHPPRPIQKQCPENKAVVKSNNKKTECKAKKTKFCYKNNCRRCCFFQSICNPKPSLLKSVDECEKVLCAQMRCPFQGQICVMDKLYNRAKCVCPTECPVAVKNETVCGTDQVTYASRCEMNMTACVLGDVIDVEYSGDCHFSEVTVSMLHQSEQVLTAGKKGKIICQFVGHPIQIIWDKTGLDKLPHRRMIPRKDILVIKKVKEVDAGQYMCSALAGGSSVTATVNVTVKVPQVITLKAIKPIRVCALPSLIGTGFKLIVRFFYNYRKRVCEPFVYSGFGGNDNNFNNKSSCIRACLHTATEVCSLPKLTGFCKTGIRKWYYDGRMRKCKMFIYGGCGGNANNFDSKAACQARCSVKNVCSLTMVTGSCNGHSAKYFYNTTSKKCEKFYYTGCDGNANRFPTMEKCKKKCVARYSGSMKKRADKRGMCPSPTQDLISCFDSMGDTCTVDNDCRGRSKCCFDGCHMTCKKPMKKHNKKHKVKLGQCPAPTFSGKVCNRKFTIDVCDTDRDCPGIRKCCHNGCNFDCVIPKRISVGRPKPGICPLQDYIDPKLCESVRDECQYDSDCFGRRKCCFSGCNMVCDLTPSSKPKPGQCPIQDSIDPELCQNHRDECSIDEQCPGDDKCCFTGCIMECLTPPGQRVRPGTCPKPWKGQDGICDRRTSMCDHDGECPKTWKCCFNGCQRDCIKPVTENRTKSGRCPSAWKGLNGICDRMGDRCDSDQDCNGREKCCFNGCQKDCVVALGGLVIPAPGKCPKPWKDPKYCDRMGDFCDSDADCFGSFKCCFTGCQKDCTKSVNLTMCQLEKQKATDQLSGELPPLGLFVPQCASDGNYANVQCHEKYCWCADTINGLEVVGTRVRGKPNCTIPVVGPREGECLRPWKGHSGACDYRGDECDMDSHCPMAQKCCFNGCQRDCVNAGGNKTVCESQREAAIGPARIPPPGRYVPTCSPDGSFEDVQCSASVGECWCVNNNNGEEVIGTRQRGEPDCSDSDPCANTLCSHPLQKCIVVQTKPRCECALFKCSSNENLVCGTDGITHPNECLMNSLACAMRRNITVKHQGACPANETIFSSPCEKSLCSHPQHTCHNVNNTAVCKCRMIMTLEYAPLCASDGKTYPNRMSMENAGCEKDIILKAVSKGPCPSILDPCEGYMCEADKFCIVINGTATCQCNQLCTADYTPVCASNGKTYSNRCAMETEACEKDIKITVITMGECGPNKTLCESQLEVGVGLSRIHPPGRYVPTCSPDGSFEDVQCHRSVGECWCVNNVNGQEVAGTRQRGQPDCSDSGLSECQKHYRTSLIYPPIGRFLPNCKGDGGYEEMQCHGSIGYCWCVNEEGKELLGSRNRGRSNCDDFDPCANTTCPFYGQCKASDDGTTACKCQIGCISVYLPVCGTDGKTYGNECEMRANSCLQKEMITVASLGECDIQDPCDTVRCGYYARCRAINGSAKCVCPLLCPLHYMPVCGSDGKMYSNECFMRTASCKQQKMISPSDPTKCKPKDLCAHTLCSHPLQKCIVVQGVPSCKCPAFDCPRNISLVCGTDGKTYPNQCIMMSAGCHERRNITAKHQGACSANKIPHAKPLDPCEKSLCSHPQHTCHNVNNTAVCKCKIIMTLNYAPLCASDANTYPNRMSMENAGCKKDMILKAVSKGPCPRLLEPCDISLCEEDKFCVVVNGTATCQCNQICTADYSPVCASNGKTYSNRCAMETEACKKDIKLSLITMGECGKDLKPGKCPKPWRGLNRLCDRRGSMCDGDRECQGNFKCCFNGCQKDCVNVAVDVKCAKDCGPHAQCVEFINGKKKCLCKPGTIRVGHTCRANPCSVIDCGFYSKCHVVNASAVCTCAKACTADYSPVCGTDGKIYSNVCELESKSCETKKLIQIASKHSCEPRNPCDVLLCSHSLHKCVNNNGTALCLCVPRPCPAIFDPVCGSNGITYPNECTMQSAGCKKNMNLKVASDGPCSPKNMSIWDSCVVSRCSHPLHICKVVNQTATCECLQAVTADYSPVCGSDGNTYPNRGSLDVHGCLTNQQLTAVSDGKCPSVTDLCDMALCSHSKHTCVVRNGTAKCVCSMFCTLQYDPVCASDGKMYANECNMEVEACKMNKRLKVIKRGSCDLSCPQQCDGNAQCVEFLVGGRKCVCDQGFKGNGTICIVDDEPEDPCDIAMCSFPQSICIPINGTATCECPQVCIDDLMPVCGSDNKTYDNMCLLEIEACKSHNTDLLFLLHEGPCPPTINETAVSPCEISLCSFPHTRCVEVNNTATCECPKACTRESYPVCGTDGKTYGNPCTLEVEACKPENLNKLQHAHDGDCPPGNRNITSDPCEITLCSFPHIECNVVNKTATCECPETCDDDDEPVCGTNGKTYTSLCTLAMEACEAGADSPSLDHDGPCPSINETAVSPCEISLCSFPHTRCVEVNNTATCECPKACTRESYPVCGTDGKTYGNPCTLEVEACKPENLNKLQHAHDGACPHLSCPQQCDRNAQCVEFLVGGRKCVCDQGFEGNGIVCIGTNDSSVPSPCEVSLCSFPHSRCLEVNNTATCECPEMCTKHYDPVCGTDGKTYGNLCSLEVLACKPENLRKLQLAHFGLCDDHPVNETTPLDACDGSQCSFPHSTCRVLIDGTATCVCPAACTRELEPVCGTDGNTYSNLCELEIAACKPENENRLHLAHNGACPPKQGTCPPVDPRVCPPGSAPVPTCSVNSDCQGDMLCCHDGCSLKCTLPSFLPPTRAKQGTCPPVDPSVCPPGGAPAPTCSVNSDCQGDMLCCHDGCSLKCVPPFFPPARDTGSPFRSEKPCDVSLCQFPKIKCVNVRGRAKCQCPRTCTEELAPVCGTDGRTYATLCVMATQACKRPRFDQLQVLKFGACDARDICGLAPAVGPCEALIPSYFFNSTSGTCEMFDYGGCLGNANLFDTQQACSGKCGGLGPCDFKVCSSPYEQCSVVHGLAKCSCNLACTREYNPQCGSDGITYDNHCLLERASCTSRKYISAAHTGSCYDINACAKCTRPYVNCVVKNNTAECQCPKICTAEYKPVCASDGKTYDTECEMKVQACAGNKDINIVSQGPCGNACAKCTRPYVNCVVKNNTAECQCPKICTAEYKPVCASDGKTYATECEMKVQACAGNKDINIVSQGPCDINACAKCTRPYVNCVVKNNTAECQCPKICTAEYKPVCASDGKTYATECEMKVQACAGNKDINIVSQGPCGNACAKCTRPYVNCVVKNNTAECQCPKICTAEYKPVCASDGKTYATKCEMKVQACAGNKDINIVSQGPCANACAKCRRPYVKCVVKNNTAECQCPKICTREYRPVCASDGKTYATECVMKVQACAGNKDINIVSRGPCVRKPGRCPPVEMCPGRIQRNDCENDDGCPGAKKCCHTGCSKICLGILPAKPDVCPQVAPKRNCPPFDRRRFCKKHSSCPRGLKCCFDGCVKQCRRLTIRPPSGKPSTPGGRPSGQPGSHSMPQKPQQDEHIHNPCDARQCHMYAKCYVVSGIAECICPVVCTLFLKSVCGSDGQTYSDECVLKQTACAENRDITIEPCRLHHKKDKKHGIRGPSNLPLCRQCPARSNLKMHFCRNDFAILARIYRVTHTNGISKLHINVLAAFKGVDDIIEATVVTFNGDLNTCKCKSMYRHHDVLAITGSLKDNKLYLDANGFIGKAHDPVIQKLQSIAKNKAKTCKKLTRQRP